MLKEDLRRLKRNLSDATKKIKEIENKLEFFSEVEEDVFELQRQTELIANKGRSLSLEISPPYKKDIYNDIIKVNQNIEIKVNDERVVIDMPFLLNKKETGNTKFIKHTLFASLEEYFSDHDYVYFPEKMVIIFEHHYKKGYKSYRDHDNIELNMIVDVLVCFFLKDDAPYLLEHYYRSVFDEDDTNFTRVYLVKKEDLDKYII